jgi:tRNA(Ile)-lysidine synthase
MLNSQWFTQECNQVITDDQQICIAYSGGVDSHVLLHLAHQTFPNLKAIHINHALSAADDQYQQHCEQVCAQLNIPLSCVTIDVQQFAGKGLENAARTARRAVWQQHLTAQDILLVAHHADDQAETILYRLLRGAGPHGLSGIKPLSKVGQAKLFRPFLQINKQQILAYAREQQLSWIQDQTNQNDQFDRNYLRNKVMPLLTRRWAHATASINRAGSLCAQLLSNLEPIMADKLARMLGNDLTLDLTTLQQENFATQLELLRAWLQRHQIIPSSKQLQLLFQQVVNARHDAQPQLQFAGKIVQRSKHRLYVLEPIKTATAAAAEETIEISWNMQDKLLLPNGEHLTVQHISTDASFIDKLKQQSVTVRIGAHGRKAKKIFQQAGVPPWERLKFPLIFVGDRLVAIAGLWHSPRF